MGVLLDISFGELRGTYQYSRRNRLATVGRDHFVARSGTYPSASSNVGMEEGLT